MIQIGMYFYLLVFSCHGGFGDISYPPNDNSSIRIITVCKDYGEEQAQQVEMHELMHACLHNHPHHFKTKKELEEHLLKAVSAQDEEALVAGLSACVADGWSKLNGSSIQSTVSNGK